MLTEMVDLIDEKLNVRNEVWIWVHQKYGMSRIIQKLHSVETKKITYVAVPEDGRLNWKNNETNDLICTKR